MTDSNYVYEKGTIFACAGGGSAPEALAAGPDGAQLVRDDSAELGVAWDLSPPGEGDVVGPSTSVDNTIPRYDGTSGKLIQASGVSISDLNIQTFPAGAGTNLTAGATASERKGTFDLASGTHAKITTTAAVTGCVIVYTVVALGTVTEAQAILTTIDTGVGFTPVSADVTDSSTVNWAIVA